MFFQEDPEYDTDELEPEEDSQDSKEIMGMSPTELIILAAMVVIIAVLGWLFLSKLFGNGVSSAPVAGADQQPTATLQPTETPVPSPTLVLSSTPIPGWSRFEFSSGQGEIWLPDSYQGGDTVDFEDIVLMTLDVYIDDQAFIDSLTPLVTNEDVVFFAVDTETPELVRFVYILRAKITADISSPIEEFLDGMNMSATGSGARITARDRVDLDYYSDVGFIVIDQEIGVVDQTTEYASLSTYGIQVEDTLWGIAFRVGREDYPDYRATIESAARTFYIQP